MRKKLTQNLILFFATIVSRPLLTMFRMSLSIRIKNGHYVKECRRQGENFILSFWHENMILPLLVHEGDGIHVLVSQHFDGEVIARVLHSYGSRTVRGSSTRGGGLAYRRMKNAMKFGKFEAAFTPDGPTGPRRRMKLGAVRLAAETGVPIISMGVAASRFRRLGSWDRLLLILPFSRCALVYGKPFYVPKQAGLKALKYMCDELTAQTNQLDQEAQACL